jgi:hypothetical protein
MKKFSQFPLWTACALWLAFAPSLRADLVFDAPTQTIPAQWSDTKISAAYKFKNTGAQAVKITDVQTSCGCTVAAPDKTTYAPGESGAINVTFDIGDRLGRQRKEITVTTDSPSQPSIVLTLLTSVPAAMTIQPEVLYWRKGDAPTPKTMTVSILEGLPFQKFDVQATGDGFRVDVKEVQHALRYDLVVTPLGLSPSATPAGNSNVKSAASPVPNAGATGVIQRVMIQVLVYLGGDQAKSRVAYAVRF